MKRIALILILISLMIHPGFAGAEETFDFRTDTAAFCDKISELNFEISNAIMPSSRQSSRPVMVLFLTEEAPLDFTDAEFTPLSVVYGPKGFSALVCTNPEAAVEWLLKQSSVQYAEIDSEVSGCSEGEEEESLSFHSWGAESAGFGEYNQFARLYGSGSCKIAIIDSGTYRHSLIGAKLIVGGHDYIDNDDDSTNDLNGHGTRVAGIVADCTQGLPVYVYPIRVLDADANGKTSNVISAILEATNAHVNIINLSLATFTQSELLESAVRSAISSGIVVVAAAGNYACDAIEVTPACMTDTGIIVVGSAEADGSRSSFSNYGDSVDLYFYGRSISSCSRSDGYVTDSGTSMAAPHISALCAMMKLTHSSISASSMVSRMSASSDSSLSIPLAAAMVPKSTGFYITGYTMRVGDTLQLPSQAIPMTSQETIHYQSADNAVVNVADGLITASSVENTVITATCKGLADTFIPITVYEGGANVIRLPSGVRIIDDEAFYGIATDKVIIPSEVTSIGNQAFDGGSFGTITLPESVETIGENTFSGAVIICTVNSAAYTYAIEHQLQYVVAQ